MAVNGEHSVGMSPSENVSITLTFELMTLRHLTSSWPDCRKCPRKFRFKSFQWFRSYRVLKICTAVAGWPWPFICSVLNIVSVKWTWEYLIVISFSEIYPFIQVI